MKVKKAARPWSGLFLGVILGLALAVILQQQGVWPLDKLLLFGMAGLFGLIGILLSGAGRERVGAFSSILTLLLAVGLLAYGATGLLDTGETGQLNGGCQVQAQSDVDSTTVTDTSRGDPFDIDPNGGLSWQARSPVAFMDHTWRIYVEIGGFKILIDEGGDPNEGESQVSTGAEPDLTAYVQTVTNATGQEIRGTFIVSGDITAGGAGCDGFGFVRLTSDSFLESSIAKIAAVIAAIALLLLLLLAFNRYRDAEPAPDTSSGEARDDGGAATGAAGAAGTAGVGDESDNGDSDGETADGEGDDSAGQPEAEDNRGAEDLPERDDLA
ncbi:MAG: hypothetical protein IH943_10250 [Acidobacteria bacterium]|nr:hypothetical protein [Acidobacteriota bacterium]